MEIKLILLLQGLLGAIAGGLGYAVLQQKRGERSTGLRVIFALSVLVIFLASSVLEPRMSHAPARVRIVSVLDEDTTSSLVESFTRETGIVCEVDPFAGGTQTTVELILQGRLQPDVLLGGTSEIHAQLADAGSSAQFRVAPDPERITTYDDEDGRWTPLYLGYLGLVYRPLPELTTHPPNWLTLLQPRWRGRVTVPDPATSGGGLVFLATQILRQPDPENAWEYLALLDANGARYEERSNIPITRVANGTMDLGVAWAHDVLRRIEVERLPVEVVIPERTGYEVGAVSILSKARDPESARRFVEFLVGRRAAEIQAVTGRRVPLRNDVEPPRYLGEGGATKGNGHFDREVVAEQRGMWLELWRERNTPQR